MASEESGLPEADSLTAGELLDDRLKTLSSGLYALARFLRVSLDDKNPSKPCTQWHVRNLIGEFIGSQQFSGKRHCSTLHATCTGLSNA